MAKKKTIRKIVGKSAGKAASSATNADTGKAATKTATGGKKRSKVKGATGERQPSKARSAPSPNKLSIKAKGLETDVTNSAPSITQLRKVKSGLSRKNLQDYRDLLLEKRAEILGDVVALESDARTDSGDHYSPEHMADIGSNNYEQEFTLGLVESERRILVDIDDALRRMENRTYGVCVERAIPIGKPRLDAKPWAKYCIEVVREKESRGKM